MALKFLDRWQTIGEPLGEGGQGKVYRVIPYSMGEGVDRHIMEALAVIGNRHENNDLRDVHYQLFEKNLPLLLKRTDPSNHKALKVLHKPKDARDSELAEERIKREITAMSEASHPNLLKIVDHDLDSKWYASDYLQKGSLSNHLNIFAGDFPKTLKAFRPLVEGVAELHGQRNVHRDIKPQNIFLDADNNLILGDFGLVFFQDEQRTRISETLENVGSRDWMPGWAFGMRLEDIKPTFDVFSLGKVLWSMVSAKLLLRLWYYEKPEFNVEQLYPDDKFIKFANPLFKKCIVEEEENCLPDASALLEEVDKTLAAIERDADKIDLNTNRKCKVCGFGDYQLIGDSQASTTNFGLSPSGVRQFKLFTCSYCGNVQLFSYEKKSPPAWQNN